jgi:HNH endonuclease
MGPLLWSWFYDYTLNGFELTSVLYDIVLALRATDAFQEFRREQKTGPGQCIYCTKTEGSFTSEEHILPEALGNDDLVLESGYVCDSCNNGLLALLSGASTKFMPL